MASEGAGFEDGMLVRAVEIDISRVLVELGTVTGAFRCQYTG